MTNEQSRRLRSERQGPFQNYGFVRGFIPALNGYTARIIGEVLPGESIDNELVIDLFGIPRTAKTEIKRVVEASRRVFVDAGIASMRDDRCILGPEDLMSQFSKSKEAAHLLEGNVPDFLDAFHVLSTTLLGFASVRTWLVEQITAGTLSHKAVADLKFASGVNQNAKVVEHLRALVRGGIVLPNQPWTPGAELSRDHDLSKLEVAPDHAQGLKTLATLRDLLKPGIN